MDGVMEITIHREEEYPLLSVIVPVYNTAPWLRKCLDSLLGQTYRNLEIICVNDGSMDNSAEILAEYAAKDARVRVITQENAGVSVARNRALAVAQGVYVTGVDSDDWLEPHAYETLLPHMEAGYDMVFFGSKSVDSQGREFDDAYKRPNAEGACRAGSQLIAGANVFFWNKLFRLDKIRAWDVRFPHGVLGEDAAFVYAYMARAESIYYEPKPLYCYLNRDASATNSERFRLRVFELCGILEWLFLYYRQHGVLQKRRDLYPLVFVELYEDAMCGLPGNLQRRAKKLYSSMVRRCGLHREYPGEYPFTELARFSFIRSLFFWRNKTTKLYKFLRWPILRVAELPTGQKKYHWFTKA